MAAPTADLDPVARAGLWILTAGVAALVIWVRLRYAQVPLERDEGEYAYAGRLILEGVPPYAQAYNMKFPGTYYAYALLMAVFGQTAWGIRVGLLVVHLATAGLVFALGRRLAGTLAGGIGAAAFGLMALDRWVLGVFAHATHFMLVPSVASLVVLHRALSSGRTRSFVAAGVLAGLAVAMKQHAVFLAALVVGLAVWPAMADADRGVHARIRRGALVSAGIVASLAAVAGILVASGVFSRFWFWTFQYAATYVSQTPIAEAGGVFAFAWRHVTQAAAGLWTAAGAGFVLLWTLRGNAVGRTWLTAWTVAAALTMVPGFYFREHYFIPLLPVVGLLIGVATDTVRRWLAPRVSIRAASLAALAVAAAAGGAYLVREAAYLFRMSDAALARSVYGTNPFLESPAIGQYIEARTSPGDRIVVLGSEPQIYFYANRRSATGHIYMYGLMEAQPYAARMQEEMIREVEAARPAYLVFVAISTSWLAGPQSDKRLLNWANEYTARCYERVGVADIHPDLVQTLRWDAAAAGYEPRSTSVVLTFRRRPGCT